MRRVDIGNSFSEGAGLFSFQLLGSEVNRSIFPKYGMSGDRLSQL